MASTRGPQEPGPVSELTRIRRGGGGERLLTTLTPEGSRALMTATLGAARDAERRLGAVVIGNRLDEHGGSEPWRRAHARWRCDLATAAREGSITAVFKGDVRDCYGAITVGLVGRRLAATGSAQEPSRAVLEILEACAAQGVRGLPVGPAASGVLANVVLAAVDDHLRGTGLPHRRWVDDVVVVAPSRRRAVAAHDAFRRALDELGLDPNLEKTIVSQSPADLHAASGSMISAAEASGMG